VELIDLLKQTRQERLAEVGTLPPCPQCGTPRVQRSDYIRCNPCGLNWLDGENWDANPKVERYQKMLATMRATLLPIKGATA